MQNSIKYLPFIFPYMIIDLILDRQDGRPYNPQTFYNMSWLHIWGQKICDALDSWDDNDIKKALKDYITEYEYPEIINEYIDSQNWI